MSHTFKSGMSHVLMSHVPLIDESCHIFESVVRHVFVCETIYISVCVEREFISPPLTAEIRLDTFGSRDLSGLSIDLLKDGKNIHVTRHSA